MVLIKIWHVIKRIIGKKKYLFPMYDRNNYPINKKTYSGASLETLNVLIVCNNQDVGLEFEERLCIENANYSLVFKTDDSLDENNMSVAAEKLVGKFNKIINIVDFKSNSLDMNIIQFKKNDCSDMSRLFYQWMQIESNYLINNNIYMPTITNVGINFSDSVDDTIAKGNTVSMIRGLGTSLGKHGVIVNGVQACKTVPINVITKTTVYLNGKYGYILAGESINMNE